jgi:O-antigen ligase
VDPFLVAFLGAFLISGVLSPYRPLALGYFGLAALTLYLAFGNTAAAVRRDPSFLRPLAAWWVAGGVIAAVWGIILHRMRDLPAVTLELGQNALGTTLLIAALLSMGLAFEVRGWGRYAAACAGLVVLTCLVLTYTRGAWLGALVGGALLLGLSGVRRLVAGTGAAVLLVVMGLAIFDSERSELISRAASIANVSANEARLFIIRSSAAIFLTHPVAGTGFGTFSLVYPAFRLPGDPNTLPMPFAHNIFMNMAAEGGVLGLITFVCVVIAGIYGGWRWHRAAREGQERATAAMFLSAFVGSIVHQMFDGTLLSVHLGMGLWMLLAILSVGWTRAAGTSSGPWTSA